MSLTEFVKSKYHLDPEKIKESNKGEKFRSTFASDLNDQIIDMYQNGKQKGLTSGLICLDQIFNWRRNGGLYCFSGYPQSGKTEVLNFLTKFYAENYGKVCIYSPEEEVIDITENIIRVYIQKNINKNFGNLATPEELSKATKFVSENYLFLEYDGMPDFEMILSEFEKRVKEGYKMFIIDPLNYIAEGNYSDSSISGTLKIALTQMKLFSKRNKVDLVYVEHQNRPRPNKDGEYPLAHVRNITNGQMHENKCDCIVVIHSLRTPDDPNNPEVIFETAKSKQQRYNGVQGKKSLRYDIKTANYSDINYVPF